MLLFKVLLELLRAFVVQAMELRLTPASGECAMDVCYGVGDAAGGSVFDRSQQDTVAIIIVCYHKVIVSHTGQVG